MSGALAWPFPLLPRPGPGLVPSGVPAGGQAPCPRPRWGAAPPLRWRGSRRSRPRASWRGGCPRPRASSVPPGRCFGVSPRAGVPLCFGRPGAGGGGPAWRGAGFYVGGLRPPGGKPPSPRQGLDSAPAPDTSGVPSGQGGLRPDTAPAPRKARDNPEGTPGTPGQALDSVGGYGNLRE